MAVEGLSAEEEAEFIKMGMAPLGAGGEPIPEDQQEAPAAGAEEVAPATEHGDRQARGLDGKFVKKEGEEAPAATPPAPGEVPNPADAAPPGYVPHAALHQERQRAAELARNMQTLTSRMNMMIQQRQQEQQPEAMPSMTDDPVAYLTALESRLARFEEAERQTSNERQVDFAINQDEEMFKLSVPDYDAASNHYVASRAQELLQYFPVHEVQKKMHEEVRQMAQHAWQNGISVAQIVYASAQARGYTPGQPAVPPAFVTPGQTAPQAPQTPQTPAPAAPAANGAAATLAAAKAGVAATRTLGGSGAAPAAELNANAILAMSDEEFAAHLKLGKDGADQRFEALFGR